MIFSRNECFEQFTSCLARQPTSQSLVRSPVSPNFIYSSLNLSQREHVFFCCLHRRFLKFDGYHLLTSPSAFYYERRRQKAANRFKTPLNNGFDSRKRDHDHCEPRHKLNHSSWLTYQPSNGLAWMKTCQRTPISSAATSTCPTTPGPVGALIPSASSTPESFFTRQAISFEHISRLSKSNTWHSPSFIDT